MSNPTTIRLLDDIYFGLNDGLTLAESRVDIAISSHSYRAACGRRDTIKRALGSLETLRANLREGRAHVEHDPECKPDSCYCAATSHPPCTFCCP